MWLHCMHNNEGDTMKTLSKILSHELTGHELTAAKILVASLAIPVALIMTVGPTVVKFFV